MTPNSRNFAQFGPPSSETCLDFTNSDPKWATSHDDGGLVKSKSELGYQKVVEKLLAALCGKLTPTALASSAVAQKLVKQLSDVDDELLRESRFGQSRRFMIVLGHSSGQELPSLAKSRPKLVMVGQTMATESAKIGRDSAEVGQHWPKLSEALSTLAESGQVFGNFGGLADIAGIGGGNFPLREASDCLATFL